MENVQVYQGEGIEFEENDAKIRFFQQNPHWPLSFGIPNGDEVKGEKKILKFQGKAYKDAYKDFENVKYSKNAVEFIIEASKKSMKETNHPLQIISIGPPINIARAIEMDPHISKSIEITLMGGWFEDENQQPIRLGYNTGLNPKDSQIIFDSGCKIKIISSQFIKEKDFCINEEEFTSLENHKNLTKLEKCIIQDWKNWNLQNSFHKKNIADPVTLYLGLKPELIIKEKSYQVNFKKFYNQKIEFLDKKSKNFIEINEKDTNLFVINDIKDSELVRKEIINTIFNILTENNRLTKFSYFFYEIHCLLKNNHIRKFS